jgi:hypothetical protein
MSGWYATMLALQVRHHRASLLWILWQAQSRLLPITDMGGHPIHAAKVCGRTDVYGFSPFVADEGHWHGRYHYFDTDIQPALQSHSFDMAYAALREVRAAA